MNCTCSANLDLPKAKPALSVAIILEHLLEEHRAEVEEHLLALRMQFGILAKVPEAFQALNNATVDRYDSMRRVGAVPVGEILASAMDYLK